MTPQEFLTVLMAVGGFFLLILRQAMAAARYAGVHEERLRWTEPLRDETGPVRIEVSGRRYWVDRDRSELWDDMEVEDGSERL